MTVENIGTKVGNVFVHTADNGGHPPEFYAERLVERLISISDNAPEPIKAQALQFKNSMYLLILDTLNRSAASERSRLAHELDKLGLSEVATFVRLVR